MDKFLDIAKRGVYIPLAATLIAVLLGVAGLHLPITTIVGFWAGSVLCWIVFALADRVGRL